MNDLSRFLVTWPNGAPTPARNDRPFRSALESVEGADADHKEQPVENDDGKPGGKADSPVPAFITVQTFATYTGVTGIIGIVVSFIKVAYQQVSGHTLGVGGMFCLTFGAALLVNGFGLMVAYGADGVKKPVGLQWASPLFLALLNTCQMTLAVLGGSAVLNGGSTTSAAGGSTPAHAG